MAENTNTERDYPELPQGWPARFRCDSCDGNGEVGDPISMGDFQPPERERCPDCDGKGWCSEEVAFSADHMRSYVDADRKARATPPMPTAVEELLRQIAQASDDGDSDTHLSQHFYNRIMSHVQTTAARPVTPLQCPKCSALWLHWPAEQTGFGKDTLNCRSEKHCDYCEKAGVEQLQRLERVTATLQAPSASLSLPAAGQEPVAPLAALMEFLRAELSAIPCRYRGDPSYDHDAYWMRARVEMLLDEAERIFSAAPQPAVAAGWVNLPGQMPEPCKPVLLDIGRKYPIRAMWAPKFTLPTDGDVDYGEYDEATDDYYCHEGWYEWNQNEETHWAVSETPRAWCELPQTLPPAPSTEGESNG